MGGALTREQAEGQVEQHLQDAADARPGELEPGSVGEFAGQLCGNDDDVVNVSKAYCSTTSPTTNIPPRPS